MRVAAERKAETSLFTFIFGSRDSYRTLSVSLCTFILCPTGTKASNHLTFTLVSMSFFLTVVIAVV